MQDKGLDVGLHNMMRNFAEVLPTFEEDPNVNVLSRIWLETFVGPGCAKSIHYFNPVVYHRDSIKKRLERAKAFDDNYPVSVELFMRKDDEVLSRKFKIQILSFFKPLRQRLLKKVAEDKIFEKIRQ